ncbi:hypothetical protein ACMSFO_22580 [Bacteroides thetaiotaomicron]|uniref:Uncharacterized protein n=1 Tax=Bacteroides thetaiotaomicron TaxID=818 RepID=A0AAW4Z7G5_BACT4|nr:hypothetical protein [Bacteroides thetaiotaomicron]MCE9237755.1 hypothetical protein [Bacteroides thetaiotaomicron]MCE9266956.1 hypothetical protein [Bacteroides thetaiotaomicron]MCE9276496.1 hypothetical protein [Bacteroides thetaiotaomicron]MCE9290057.1 hypothetical protein [Bacteroides thetaiotaomicron]
MSNFILETLNPNELRIGNLVNGGVTLSLCRVTKILKDEEGNNIEAIAVSVDSRNEFRMLLGIRLDATRLLCMGFIQDSKDECLFKHNWFALKVTYERNLNSWHFEGIYSNPSTIQKRKEGNVEIRSSDFSSVNERLKYVHEYQNLYFRITQTELSL